MTPEFQILSPREHVRKRIGLYLGSSSKEYVDRFLGGKWETVCYVPSLNKIIDEIIDNSIDCAIRENYKYANKIDVTIEGNQVTVTDNGTGIPQELVVTPEGEKIKRPVAAWTRVNAGTSFTDDRVSIGANGVGSSCTNFVSSEFKGVTWQLGKCLTVHCTNGAENIVVTESKKAGNGTSVSFTPDFSLFEVDSLGDLDTAALVEDRLVGLQMSFPEITFSFNGKKIQVRDIKKYSEMFSGEGTSVILEKNDNLSFFFTSSNDGYRSNSFNNGVNTRIGGTYVDYIVNSVVEELLILIKKKHKIEVGKSVVKNGLTFISFARNFVNPKYDSQTKERLTNSLGEVKSHYEKYCNKDFKLLAKKLFAADDIIAPIIEAQIAKKNADELRSSIVAQKKLKKVKVAKHIAASSDQASLFLVEGDSAISKFLEVRNPKLSGAYPLRGVVMNTWDMKSTDVLKNKELSELVSILGLDINNPKSYSNMNYAKIAIMCDSDKDGHHIASLLVAFFFKFWPQFVRNGCVGIVRSPIMISTKGNETKWFYNYSDAMEFKNSSKGYNHRYIKGLGSLETKEYDVIVNNPVLDVVGIDDETHFEMMFGKAADKRKEFMLS